MIIYIYMYMYMCMCMYMHMYVYLINIQQGLADAPRHPQLRSGGSMEHGTQHARSARMGVREMTVRGVCEEHQYISISMCIYIYIYIYLIVIRCVYMALGLIVDSASCTCLLCS